ncbi:MAG: hypothetical protein A2527_12815 [Candidatus Lambdaproteobacteria bacterium RIFOXYD2_FULL_50_16]|uniref:Uncharacterized protein n=1 Tax=Candidatus Lambdaproteobacteria bacterium RIFOXYD2_FULL_50_16 TaxID=1817772 RepID=A0A1F6G9P3_9PROT|nr:MAG: hypothetical protein A2527_12815 [Candidatus Lambdaproteobacteria bacterium RIFOXYD2_FULL_50_16]
MNSLRKLALGQALFWLVAVTMSYLTLFQGDGAKHNNYFRWFYPQGQEFPETSHLWGAARPFGI